MRSLFALLSLVLASAAPQLFSMLETDRSGGITKCEGAIWSPPCEASTGGSHCRPNVMPQFNEAPGTWATHLKSMTDGPGNCNTFLGSDGLACVAMLQQNSLPQASCTKRTL